MTSEPAKGGDIAYTDLTRHTYTIARSGHGKSALLLTLIKQLMSTESQAVYPCAMIYLDPKGDDAIKVLQQMDVLDPEKITFLDPVRSPFAINPLELPPHDSEDADRIRSTYTGFVMRLVQEWYQIDKVSEAPRMLRIIERVVDALYYLHGAPTFIDLHHVITVFQAGDEGEVEGLLNQFASAMPSSSAEELRKALASIAGMKGEAFDPVLTRLERFATDPFLKRLFCVRHSTVDFAKLLEPGHLTVIRVPAHEVGFHIAPFIMGTLIIRLWFSILERASRLAESERTPVILAVDEFQEVKGLGVLEQMLAQARAFRLGLWLSHQNLQQVDDQMLASILGNTGTQIAGNLNGEDAAKIARNWERDQAMRQAIESELVTLPDWNFLVRELPPPGGEQQPPYREKSLAPPPLLRSYDQLKPFLEEERLRYGLSRVERSIFSQKKEDWEKFSTVRPIPQRAAWLILTALEKGPGGITRICELSGLPRDEETTKAVEGLHDFSQIKVVRSDRAGNRTYGLTNGGLALLPPTTKEGFESIGKEDAQEIALAARRYYLEHGFFFAIGRQDLKMERKPDCVAFDYDRALPIAGEIESTNHVQTHPEELKSHLLEVEPFRELHVWCQGGVKTKVEGLIAQLPEDQREKIKVFVV